MRVLHHCPNRNPNRKIKLTEAEWSSPEPTIYIGGAQEVEQILTDHPEISFVATLDDRDGTEPEDLCRAMGSKPRYQKFPIRDWDFRAAGGYHKDIPSKENVEPVLTYLNEWVAAGCPSILIHCAQGHYRSTTVGLLAHTLATGGDPERSATVLREAGVTDTNWEIARFIDQLGNFNDAFIRAARSLSPKSDAIERESLEKSEKEFAKEVRRLESDLEKMKEKYLYLVRINEEGRENDE